MVVKMIETPRLILRQWRDTDYLPFAEMSANPELMRYFPKVLSRAESNAYIDKLKAIIQKQGWGFLGSGIQRNPTIYWFCGFT